MAIAIAPAQRTFRRASGTGSATGLLQFQQKFVRGWEAACRRLAQTAHNDWLQACSGEFAERLRFFVTDGLQRLQLGFP